MKELVNESLAIAGGRLKRVQVITEIPDELTRTIASVPEWDKYWLTSWAMRVMRSMKRAPSADNSYQGTTLYE